LPHPWTTVIAQHELQDVFRFKLGSSSAVAKSERLQCDLSGRNGEVSSRVCTLLQPPAHLAEQYKQLFLFMSVRDEDYERMIDYRTNVAPKVQQLNDRARSADAGTAEQSFQQEIQPSTAEMLHSRFTRFLDVSMKDFYTSAAAEVERWLTGRDQLYEMKFRVLRVDISRGATLDSMLYKARSTIATSLRCKFSEQRNRTKFEFAALFSQSIRGRFPQLSPVAMQVLMTIEQILVTEVALCPLELGSIIDGIPTEGFFVSDVLSIIFSFYGGLCVPESLWLPRLKSKVKFSLSSKQMVDLPNEVGDLSWVFQLNPDELGVALLRWLCSTSLFNSLAKGCAAGDAVSSPVQLLQFLTQVDPLRLRKALVPEFEFSINETSTRKLKQAITQQLSGSVHPQVLDLLSF
jgi:hypothetical protein